MNERPTNSTTTADHLPVPEGIATAETLAGETSQSTRSNVLEALPHLASGLAAFEILEPLRKFRDGTAYLARHRSLDRIVVLRILEGEAAKDSERRAQFLLAANACSAISHPNLGTILEASQGDDTYIAEEYFDGGAIAGFEPRTVAERRREFVYPNRELAALMLQAAAGLDCLHKHGASSGKLTRQRILADEHGLVKIVGVGEASEEDEGDRVPGAVRKSSSDLRSLGDVFWQIAAGRKPEPGETTSIAEANPGINKAMARIIDGLRRLDDAASTMTAETLCGNLGSVVRHHVDPCAFWPRAASIGIETLIAWVFTLLAYMLASASGQVSAKAGSWPFLAMAWLFPLAYFSVFELAFRWTPTRRTYGFRVIGENGDPPRLRANGIRQAMRAGWTLAWILGLSLASSRIAFGGYELATTGMIPLMALSGLAAIPLGFASAWATRFAFDARMPLHEIYSGVRLAHVDDAAETPTQSSIGSSPPLGAHSHLDERAAIDTVDQYELIEIVGAGGMGQVYCARDTVLGRMVALKVMASRGLADETELQRFQREARLAANLSHPNIAKAFDFGRWDNQPYVVVEFVDGPTLQQIVKENGPLPIEKAWNFIIQAAEGLRAADRAGVVHRDIKPSNLIVNRSGVLKVVDFGIARKASGDEGLTRTGTFVGTPKYMSPEQATGKEIDCRSDIYSLGMTLYHLLAGEAPFSKGNPMEILAQQLSEQPPKLLGKVRGLTDERHAILFKMIAKKREDRFANHDELLKALYRESPSRTTHASVVSRCKAELQNLILWFFSVLIFWIAALELLAFVAPADSEPALKARFALYGIVVRYGTGLIGLAFCGMYLAGIARWGKTFGKWTLGLRVLRCDGRRVGWVRSTARFFAIYPSIAVLIASWGIPWLHNARAVGISPVGWAILFNVAWLAASALYGLRNPNRQMLHDRLLDTIVVDTPRFKLPNWSNPRGKAADATAAGRPPADHTTPSK